MVQRSLRYAPYLCLLCLFLPISNFILHTYGSGALNPTLKLFFLPHVLCIHRIIYFPLLNLLSNQIRNYLFQEDGTTSPLCLPKLGWCPSFYNLTMFCTPFYHFTHQIVLKLLQLFFIGLITQAKGEVLNGHLQLKVYFVGPAGLIS